MAPGAVTVGGGAGGAVGGGAGGAPGGPWCASPPPGCVARELPNCPSPKTASPATMIRSHFICLDITVSLFL
ncbi:MAG TPA: hypothetical protein VGA79_09740 [Desulfobaccales bacterium]